MRLFTYLIGSFTHPSLVSSVPIRVYVPGAAWIAKSSATELCRWGLCTSPVAREFCIKIWNVGDPVLASLIGTSLPKINLDVDFKRLQTNHMMTHSTLNEHGFAHRIESACLSFVAGKYHRKIWMENSPGGRTFSSDQRVCVSVLVCGVTELPNKMPSRFRCSAPGSCLTLSTFSSSFSRLHYSDPISLPISLLKLEFQMTAGINIYARGYCPILSLDLTMCEGITS